jgi:hypothetical protein
MADTRDEVRHGESIFASLWRRAPWWRASIVGAAIVTVAATVFWAESQPAGSGTAAGSAPASAAAKGSSPQTVQATPASASGIPPSVSAPAQPAVARVTDAGAANPAASEEEEQTEAICHPHLLHAPTSMPQIDVANTPEPGLGHIKFHFWVDGAGMVTREVLTAATFGSPAEQQAEAAFAKGLTFSLPDTKQCRSAEVEVIGDFFERREQAGRWATYVRLYPRYTFGNTGVLQRAD